MGSADSEHEREAERERAEERDRGKEGGRIGACDEVRGGKKAGENNLV